MLSLITYFSTSIIIVQQNSFVLFLPWKEWQEGCSIEFLARTT